MLRGTNLAVSYGDSPVFEHLDVDVPDSGMTAVCGPSGSGKSTLLAVLGALMEPDDGMVLLDGRPLTPARARTSISWVPQGNNLLPHRTVAANASLGLVGVRASERRARTLESIDAVGLLVRRRNRAGTLSGGEAQRLAIARAHARGCPWIFADEPTGQLDRRNTEIVVAVLRGLRDTDRGLLVATHDPLVLEAADHVVDLASP